jgi:2-oxoglutarate ferredoxin oxidoreductase subunit alpha
VVLAPGDVQECFFLTAKALNLAERYQMPVLVLSDKHLSETTFSTERFDISKVKIERGKIATRLPQLPAMARWKRYEFTEDCVSPRALPGTENGMHVASSYEHGETGFSSESFQMRAKQADKRAGKLPALLKEMPGPNVYGDRKAGLAIAGWGSMKLPALDALKLLEARGIKARFVHFTHLFPLNPRAVKSAFRGAKNLIMVENNSTAQFAGMLAEYAGIRMDFHILKYDGRPFFPEQIADEIAKLKAADFKGEKTVKVVETEDLEYYNTQRHGL